MVHDNVDEVVILNYFLWNLNIYKLLLVDDQHFQQILQHLFHHQNKQYSKKYIEKYNPNIKLKILNNLYLIESL